MACSCISCASWLTGSECLSSAECSSTWLGRGHAAGAMSYMPSPRLVLTRLLLCHLLAGLSDGSDSSSGTRRALLWLLFIIQLSYCLALAGVNPQIDLVQGLCDMGCTCLETVAVLCTCLLQVSRLDTCTYSVSVGVNACACIVQCNMQHGC